MHCSGEDFSFNSICLYVLEGINQFYLSMWFKKTRLETLFKGDNVKALVTRKDMALSAISIYSALLISKFQVGLKSLLRQGLSEPDFYGDLVYKLKKIVGSNNFSAQFIKIISHYKKIGYNINVLQQTACLVVNPITIGNFAFLFNCTPVGRTSDSMMVPT